MYKKYSNINESHVVDATNKEHLYENGKVFNLHTFGPTLYVHIDEKLYHDYRLMNVYDTVTHEGLTTYQYDELDHPWVDIPVDVLNLCTGLHTYTLEFVNIVTGDTFYQYFNYTIQDDHPCKPYIYMKR